MDGLPSGYDNWRTATPASWDHEPRDWRKALGIEGAEELLLDHASFATFADAVAEFSDSDATVEQIAEDLLSAQAAQRLSDHLAQERDISISPAELASVLVNALVKAGARAVNVEAFVEARRQHQVAVARGAAA